MKKTFSLLLIAAAALSAHAVQAQTKLENCAIQEVLPGKNMTGGFARFVHTGAPVEIVRAEVPTISQRIELHSMAMKNGVMEMIPLTNPKLEAGERIFKKGADHVMLFDIKENPKVGSIHKMRVFFSNGTLASCDAVVKSVEEVMKEAGIGAASHTHKMHK